MTNQKSEPSIKTLILLCLDETFSNIHGIYLDKGTTFFDTIAGISASEASSAASSQSATIAAQVDHVRLYLDVLNNYLRTGEHTKTDWEEIWKTVRTVTPEDWETLQLRLRFSHENVLNTINEIDDWNDQHGMGGALAILVHTAYHLGGIRQALGAIRARENEK